MFEIGWTEILFVAIIAIFVLRPKDYPDALRAIGNFLTKARQMAGEFQSQFNEAMRDANLDDVRKTIDEIRDLKNMGPMQQVREHLTSFADDANQAKKSIESATTPSAFAPDPYVGPMATNDPYVGNRRQRRSLYRRGGADLGLGDPDAGAADRAAAGAGAAGRRNTSADREPGSRLDAAGAERAGPREPGGRPVPEPCPRTGPSRVIEIGP